MQIVCTQCKKAFNIPDDKIPKGQAFNVGCPACKAKIKVDQHLKKEAPAPVAAPKKDVVDASSMVVQEDFSEDDELKIYGDDDQVALLLDSRHKDVWTKFLKEKNIM